MKISVVIPVYNVKDYLPKCMESVLLQDCSDCEIILVDDGSTDGESNKICDLYASEHSDIVRVIHKENGGVGDARNVGVEEATGEYIMFVDSDDYIAEGTLEKLKAAVDEYKCDVVLFGFRIDSNGKLSEPYIENVPERTEFCMGENRQLMFVEPNPWGRLWRRSLIVDSGIKFPCRMWYEDICTTIKLLTIAESVVHLPEPLYRYVVRPGSITHNTNAGRNAEILYAFDIIINWFKENGLFEEYYNELSKLAVDHVLLAASVRVIRTDPKHPVLERIQSYMDEKFPDYMSNPYMDTLSGSHKLLLRLLRNKMFKSVKILFLLKDKLKAC